MDLRQLVGNVGEDQQWHDNDKADLSGCNILNFGFGRKRCGFHPVPQNQVPDKSQAPKEKGTDAEHDYWLKGYPKNSAAMVFELSGINCSDHCSRQAE